MNREQIIALFADRERAFRRHDATALTDFYSDNAVVESPMYKSLRGRSEIHAAFHSYFVAFPDAEFTSDEILADGDEVAEMVTIAGTKFSLAKKGQLPWRIADETRRKQDCL